MQGMSSPTVRYSTIYSSFAGTIGISQVKMGALVTANQTLLNTISSEDPDGRGRCSGSKRNSPLRAATT